MVRRCLRHLLGAVASVAGWLPGRVVRWLGGCLGFAVFSLLRVRRRVTLDNIDRSLQLSPSERRRLAGRVYRHLCVGALEFLQLPRLTRGRAEELLGDGAARLEQLRADRGLLVLTAHLGQWDLLACAAAL
jgi:lauroyl/myristoyl acyltransferase